MQPTITDRQVEQRLAAIGVRFTKGRRRVLDALESADGPLSAAEVHAGLEGNVPLSSVYRSLAVLEEAGVVAPHNSVKGITRYEPAEWLTGHHHHLVCRECGAVDDIRLTEQQENTLEELVDRVTAAAGFRPRGHSLEIDGRCFRCS